MSVYHLAEHIGFTPDFTSDLDEAKSIFLRSPDVLGEWISAKTMGVSRVAMAARLEDVTAEDFKHSSVGVMISIAFDAGQPAQTRAAVLDAIGERFLADGHTQSLAAELAKEIEQSRLAQEQEDREDLAAERKDFPAMVRDVRRGAL